MNSNWRRCFFTACVIHALVLFGVGQALNHLPAYGMQIGQSSVEMELLAAPSEAVPPTEAPQPLPSPEPEVEPEMQIPSPNKPPPATPASASPAPPQTGRDATTARSEEGATSEARPEYLRNPPPVYPAAARRLGQEGRVLLCVDVDARGRPTGITVKASSGFSLLDNAAVLAVQRWVFSPGTVASIPTASRVSIPIRFRLTE